MVGLAALALGVGPWMAQGQSFVVPNGSFESPSTSFASPFVDDWQKPAKPDYFDEAAFGFQWVQTAGVFANTAPGSPDHIDNMDGLQSAFLLGFPQAALFQELPEAEARYTPGLAYRLEVDLFGKGLTEGSILTLGLYYRDDADQAVSVGTLPIVYSAAAFPSTTHFSEFVVEVPVVQAGDAWAGEPIGVMLESTFGTGSGFWDVDNVRVTAVPEPMSLGLVGVGLAGLALLRMRRCRQG